MSTKKFKDRKKLDRIHCRTIAKSISEVLRFSTNENFRKEAFHQFGVFSTKQTEREINKRLKQIIKNQNLGNMKAICCKTELISNAQEQEITNSQSEHIKENSSSKSSVNTDSKLARLSSSIHNSSWLHTSSEKYKKNLEFLKKQKLSCFSQPQLSERSKDCPEPQFHSCEIYQNGSQLTDMSSLSSISQEISSSEVMDDRSYYKMRFKESFKDNIHKYFKKLKVERDSSVEKRQAKSIDDLFL